MNLYIPIQKSFTKAPAKEVVKDQDSIAESIDPAKRLAYWKAECIGLKERMEFVEQKITPQKMFLKRYRVPAGKQQVVDAFL